MKNSSLWIMLYRMRQPILVIIVTYTIAIIGLILIEGVDDKGQAFHMSIFDAFYFITYTATTIGFGEIPYAFTYSQKIWVSISIYLTVLGWFYGIGSLVTLLQDKLLIQELKRARFKSQVKNIKQKFIIVLGYSSVTSQIIKKALEYDIRTVVIESNENRVNDLILESFTPHVPVLIADAQNRQSLQDAGVDKFNCKAIVSLFDNDRLNLRVAIIAKLLNKNISLAVKATSEHQNETLEDVGAEVIANPFSVIASEIDIAFKAPNILKLEKWIYKLDDLNAVVPKFPVGKYIICGCGRMGKYLYEKLKDNDIELVFIELDGIKVSRFCNDDMCKVIVGDADDKDILIEAGIVNSVAIIVATNDDTTNLSILQTAKKLNPKIMTIARENEMDDFSIFQNAKIDHIFMPANILIHKTTNALINPLSDKFLMQMISQDEKWASKLVRELIEKINENPIILEIDIIKQDAVEIYHQLVRKKVVTLHIFRVSLYNRELNNNVVPLLLVRGKENILLPSWDIELQKNDRILFACDEYAKHDMEYISQNYYEFNYALLGKEKSTIIKRIFK